MSKRRGRLTAIVLLIAVTLVSAALIRGTEGQALQGEYKIGVLEPLTGALAFEGKRHLEGYEIMRDMINERGGVMGKKLVFVVGDGVDPTAAASEANRLITREGVKIITGTFDLPPVGDVDFTLIRNPLADAEVIDALTQAIVGRTLKKSA